MNVHKAIKDYVIGMLEQCGQGMKVLLMDQETVGIVSLVFTMSEIGHYEVFMLDKLENQRAAMKHLKATVFIRPTKENISLLHSELRNPKYSQYFLYFSNVLSRQELKSLAEADEHEAVREVQEIFADYWSLSPHLFSLNQSEVISGGIWRQSALTRCADGLCSLLLSLKKLPYVRYQSSSANSKRLAEQVSAFIDREKESLFNFRQRETVHLLILDRKEDSVTPLLNQWTYQAMINELLSIKNNRVELPSGEVTLCSSQDEFYRENMFVNFGDIGQAIKSLMEEFQRKQQATAGRIESISDMKNFLENYPAFKRMSGNVTKHVNLMSEISRLVGEKQLLEVSELEQELVCQGGEASSMLSRVQQIVRNPRIDNDEALRLTLLFALRYETQAVSGIAALREALTRRGLPEHQTSLIRSLLQYGGNKARSSDLFGTKTPLSVTKRLFKGLKGVENIFTQHEPLLSEIIDAACKGKMRESQFPFVNSSSTNLKPNDLIVFIIGGATYEESLTVHNVNKTAPGINVLLGGTNILDSRSFLSEVVACTEPPQAKASNRF